MAIAELPRTLPVDFNPYPTTASRRYLGDVSQNVVLPQNYDREEIVPVFEEEYHFFPFNMPSALMVRAENLYEKVIMRTKTDLPPGVATFVTSCWYSGEKEWRPVNATDITAFTGIYWDQVDNSGDWLFSILSGYQTTHFMFAEQRRAIGSDMAQVLFYSNPIFDKISELILPNYTPRYHVSNH